MKDRAERDVRGSVLLTPAGASRAARHASLEKRAFVPQDKSSFFVYHVNTSDQFPSWWHKTVPQRSGHSFEARSSGASSHFVPLHHDPATRSRAEAKKRPVRLRDLAARRGLVPKGAFLSCAM